MRLSIRFKLALLAFIPLLLYTGTSFVMVEEQRGLYENVSEQVFETGNLIQELVLNADRDMYQSYVAYLKIESGMLSGEELDLQVKDLNDNLQQVEDRMGQAMGLIRDNGLGQLQYGASGKTVEQLMEEFRVGLMNWKEASQAAGADGQSLFVNESVEASFFSSRGGIDEIDDNIDQHVQQTMEQISKDLKGREQILITAVLIVTVCIAIAVFLLIRHMMKTIRAIVTKTNKVAEGDLTMLPERKYSKDELGLIAHSLDSMIASVRQLVMKIADNAQEVGNSSKLLSASAKESTDASAQVALDIQDVAESTDMQARAAKETARAVEEMSIGIQRIADNTSQIADLSTDTSQQTKHGLTAMKQFTEQIQEVNAVLEKLSITIDTLGTRSDQIAGIADNITSFSNQTNILSLNASIEAARAGEAGRGFAVVASEIRKLAASSLTSADDIHQLVDGTRKDIAEASVRMKEALQEMEAGKTKVAEMGSNFNRIAAAVSNMSSQIQENSAITEQMSASSEQVSASMDETATSADMNLGKTESVAAATEQQLALMDSIATLAKQLDAIVGELDSAVTRFTV